MAITKLPKIGLFSNLTVGSSGWGLNRNFNSDRLEQIVGAEIKGIVATAASLPGSPANGDTYYVTDTTSLSSRFYGAWFTQPTPKGLVIYNSTTDSFLYFDGTAIQAMAGTGSVNSVTGYYVDNTDPINPVVIAPKSEVSSTAPTVMDDNTQDFSIGSRWFDTVTRLLWICEDASTGAAVWTSINGESNCDVSAESGVVTETTTTPQDIGVSATITTTGKRVFVGLTCDASSGYIRGEADTTSTTFVPFLVNLEIYRGATKIYDSAFGANAFTGSGTNAFLLPPSAVWTIDEGVIGTPGTYVYTFRFAPSSASGGSQAIVDNVKIVAYEL